MAKMERPMTTAIKNWPNDPKMKIFISNGTLYGGYRLRKRDPKTHRQHEQKVYSGRIVDNVYYPMEEFRAKFTRTGKLRDEAAAAKTTGLSAEVVDLVQQRNEERQALMSQIAGMLEDFDGTLNGQPPVRRIEKKTMAAGRKDSDAPEGFSTGKADLITDVAGVSVTEMRSAGAGATLVELPAGEHPAVLVELGKPGFLWGGDVVKTSGTLKGSVFVLREADAAAAVTRLWDKCDAGVVLTVPGDDKTRFTSKQQLLLGTQNLTQSDAGAGLGLAMGQGTASRCADGFTVGVYLAGSVSRLEGAANGKAVIVAVTDACLALENLQVLSLAAATGFARTGLVARGLTILAVSLGSVYSDGETNVNRLAAAMVQAVTGAMEKCRA